MAQTRLETVTLQTLAQAAQAAGQVVQAYRLGGRRLLGLLARSQQASLQAAQQVAGQLGHTLADTVARSGAQVQGLAQRGLERVGDGADAAIAFGEAGAARQVRRVAGLAGRVQHPVLSKGLDAAARASLPGARVALSVSQRLAQAADRLPQAAAGAPARTPVRKAKAVKAVKAATASKAEATAKVLKAPKTPKMPKTLKAPQVEKAAPARSARATASARPASARRARTAAQA